MPFAYFPTNEDWNKPTRRIAQKMDMIIPQPQASGKQKHTKIMMAAFNIRQACINLALLGDHLSVKGMYCGDCIRKHTMQVVGYLQEAFSLYESEKYRQVLEEALPEMNQISYLIAAGQVDSQVVCQLVRTVRKRLQPYSDDILFYIYE